MGKHYSNSWPGFVTYTTLTKIIIKLESSCSIGEFGSNEASVLRSSTSTC
jgi:hypothetical protein